MCLWCWHFSAEPPGSSHYTVRAAGWRTGWSGHQHLIHWQQQCVWHDMVWWLRHKSRTGEVTHYVGYAVYFMKLSFKTLLSLWFYCSYQCCNLSQISNILPSGEWPAMRKAHWHTACLGTLLWTWIKLNPAWISNYIHYEMCNEITNFQSQTSMVQQWKFGTLWISNWVTLVTKTKLLYLLRF